MLKDGKKIQSWQMENIQIYISQGFRSRATQQIALIEK